MKLNKRVKFNNNSMLYVCVCVFKQLKKTAKKKEKEFEIDKFCVF